MCRCADEEGRKCADVQTTDTQILINFIGIHIIFFICTTVICTSANLKRLPQRYIKAAFALFACGFLADAVV